MNDIYRIAKTNNGLSPDEIRDALDEALAGRIVRKALLLPPDYTRYHSNAGFITNYLYHKLVEQGAEVDVMPALGTHVAVTR